MERIGNRVFLDFKSALESQESLERVSEKARQVLVEAYANRLYRAEVLELKLLSERITNMFGSISGEQNDPALVMKYFPEIYFDSTEKNYCFNDMPLLLEGLPTEESKTAFKRAFESLSKNFYSYMLKELIPLVRIFPDWEERIECLEKSILFDGRLRIEHKGSKPGDLEKCFSKFCKEAHDLLSKISEPKLKLPILKSLMLLSVHKINPRPNWPDPATRLMDLLNTLPSEEEKLRCLQKLDTFHENHPSCSLNSPGMLELLTQIEQARWDEFLEAAAFMGNSYNPIEHFEGIFLDPNKWRIFSELIFSLYEADARVSKENRAFHPKIKYTLFATINEISNEECPLFSRLLKPLSISTLFDPNIHKNSRSDRSRAYRAILEDIICLLSAFQSMSSDEKKLFLQIRDSFLKENMSNFEIIEISLDLADIPPAKRLQFSEAFNASAIDLQPHAISATLKIKAYFHSHPQEYDALLSRVPLDQLGLFFKNMAYLLQDFGNKELETAIDRNSLFPMLPKRADYIQTLSALLERFKKIDPWLWGNYSKAFVIPEKLIKDHRKLMVDAFASIDPVNWALFSKTMTSLLQGGNSAAQSYLIVRLKTNVSAENWQSLSNLIDISTPKMLSRIKERLESASSIGYLLKGIHLCLRPEMTDDQKEAITSFIIEADEKEYDFTKRNLKLKLLESYVKPEMSAQEILAFLPFIAKPNLWKICQPLSDEGMTSLWKIAALCLRPEMTDAELESIVKALSKDPQENLTRLQPHIKPEMTTTEILFLMPFISDRNLWDSYTSIIDPALRKGFPLEAYSENFKKLSPPTKIHFFSLIMPYMKGVRKQQLKEAIQFFASLACWPSPFVEPAIVKAQSLANSETDHHTFLSLTEQVFSDALFNYLSNCIGRTDLNWKERQEAINAAASILKIQIKDSAPLKQAAIQTILWLTGNKYEPHYVHAHLRAVRSSGYTPLRETIKPASVLLSDPFCKVTLKLDLEGIQKGLRRIKQKEKSGEEFQAWIEHVNQTKQPDSPFLGPTVFVDLFQNLNERLQTVSPPDRDLQAAAHQTAKWLTDPKHFCGKLLQKPFESATPSEQKLLIRLYEIAAAILKKSNTLAPEQALSPREEAMMIWLRLIEQCSTGQEEGIHVCYNALRVSGEIEGKIEETSILPGAEKTENFLAFEVQKVMENVIAFPETLEALRITAAGALKQMVHQTRYMRGILALVYEDCGLDYPVEVDPNGGTVSRELMARSRETILEVIFRQTTKHLISSLKRGINAHLFEDKLYDNINMFLAAHGITDTRQIWKMNKEGVVELSDFGTITLLEKGGYLHADLGKYKLYLELQSQIEETEKELHTLRNVTPISREIILDAKSDLDTSEKAMVRALRTKDPYLESIKEQHREAKENYEELLIKEQSAQETLTRANSIKSLIASLENELEQVRIHLEGEALQEEVLPPIAVIQERLIESTLPADIQFLEDRWKTAQVEANSAEPSEANSLQEVANQHKKTFEMALDKYQRHL